MSRPLKQTVNALGNGAEMQPYFKLFSQSYLQNLVHAAAGEYRSHTEKSPVRETMETPHLNVS